LFLEEQRERIFYKGGPSAPMNQRFSDSLFILGCLFSLRFLENKRERGFYKGGPSAPMNQIFTDSLFIWVVYFLFVFWRNRGKGLKGVREAKLL
jgi:hypothetical protein